MTKNDLIKALELEPHPCEGGYFKRTYESDICLDAQHNQRKLLTTIYYMLTDDSPIGYMHTNRSDIMHFYHGGSAMVYWIISPQGQLSEQVLGPDITKGESPQLLVKGGYWKTSKLCRGDYGLIGEAVAPGFEYSDNQIATHANISQLFPHLVDRFAQYIKG